MILIVVTLGLSAYVWKNGNPAAYKSIVDYLGALLGPLAMALACLWYVSSWPTIRLEPNGLNVEFVIPYLHVSWEDILKIEYIGSKTFGTWVILTKNRLTPFHIIFGLFYCFSLKPAFLIHTQSSEHKELISEIRKHIKK